VEDQEREAEDPEGVFGVEVAVAGVDVEALGEAANGRGRQLAGVRVDVGQVVAGPPRRRPRPARAPMAPATPIC
jgi:hypothetical protein